MMIETADSITMRYSLARGVAPATVLCNVLAVSEHLQLGWGFFQSPRERLPRGAGEQDGAHRLGGDVAREGIPAQGYGRLVAHGTGLELAREQ